MERIANYPGHILGDSHVECYQNEEKHDEVTVDSFSEDVDSECAADEASDEDSEDGIHSH